jgi:hypothetical protein
MTWLDDFQRRLAIAGARSLGQQVAGQVGRTVRGKNEDVWQIATTEPVDASAGNAPECAWCPICRAIRMARDSNPDMAGRVGETAGALMAAAHDVAAAVDAALSRRPAQPRSQSTSSPPREPARPAHPAAPADRRPAHPAAPADRGPAGPQPPDAPPAPNGQQAGT